MSVQVERLGSTEAAGTAARRGRSRGWIRRAWDWSVHERVEGPGPDARAAVARLMRLAPPH